MEGHNYETIVSKCDTPITMAFVLLLSTSVFATQWYVKTTGSNGNSGASWATAFQTISQAVSSSNDGDIIYVEGNIY